MRLLRVVAIAAICVIALAALTSGRHAMGAQEAVLCKKISRGGQPIQAAEWFPPDTGKIYAWFPSGAVNKPTKGSIEWLLNGARLTADNVTIKPKRPTWNSYSLPLNETLPNGLYEAVLRLETRIIDRCSARVGGKEADTTASSNGGEGVPGRSASADLTQAENTRRRGSGLAKLPRSAREQTDDDLRMTPTAGRKRDVKAADRTTAAEAGERKSGQPSPQQASPDVSVAEAPLSPPADSERPAPSLHELTASVPKAPSAAIAHPDSDIRAADRTASDMTPSPVTPPDVPQDVPEVLTGSHRLREPASARKAEASEADAARPSRVIRSASGGTPQVDETSEVSTPRATGTSSSASQWRWRVRRLGVRVSAPANRLAHTARTKVSERPQAAGRREIRRSSQTIGAAVNGPAPVPRDASEERKRPSRDERHQGPTADAFAKEAAATETGSQGMQPPAVHTPANDSGVAAVPAKGEAMSGQKTEAKGQEDADVGRNAGSEGAVPEPPPVGKLGPDEPKAEDETTQTESEAVAEPSGDVEKQPTNAGKQGAKTGQSGQKDSRPTEAAKESGTAPEDTTAPDQPEQAENKAEKTGGTEATISLGEALIVDMVAEDLPPVQLADDAVKLHYVELEEVSEPAGLRPLWTAKTPDGRIWPPDMPTELALYAGESPEPSPADSWLYSDHTNGIIPLYRIPQREVRLHSTRPNSAVMLHMTRTMYNARHRDWLKPATNWYWMWYARDVDLQAGDTVVACISNLKRSRRMPQGMEADTDEHTVLLDDKGRRVEPGSINDKVLSRVAQSLEIDAEGPEAIRKQLRKNGFVGFSMWTAVEDGRYQVWCTIGTENCRAKCTVWKSESGS